MKIKQLDIKGRENLIHSKNGLGIPITALPIFILFTLLSLIFTLNSLIGLIPLVIFTAPLTNRVGTYLDLDKKELVNYSSFFGIKFGKWRDISKFKHISIIPIKEGSRISGSRWLTQNILGYNTFKSYYDIFLVRERNLDRIFVSRFKTKNTAQLKMDEFVSIYNFLPINYWKESLSRSKIQRAKIAKARQRTKI